MRAALLILMLAIAIVPMAPSADAHICVQVPGGFPCSCPPDHDRLHIHVNYNSASCAHVPPPVGTAAASQEVAPEVVFGNTPDAILYV